MNNNDVLIRLRYALDIKDTDIVSIFKLGSIDVSEEEVRKILFKSKDENHRIDNVEMEENEDTLNCTNLMLESFLNGFVIYKRGRQESQVDKPIIPPLSMNNRNVYNVMLKKLKIALELSSEDMLDILKESGLIITKGELSAVFRKEGQKNYKECGERYARYFLKGLAIRYRK